MSDNKNRKTNTTKNIKKGTPNPVCVEICKIFSEQIQGFLYAPVANRKSCLPDLFTIEDDDLQKIAFEQGCAIYLLERSARVFDDDNRLSRMSMNAVMIDKQTCAPKYYINAYINPNEIGAVAVYPMFEDTHATDYKSTARWNNRRG